MIDKINQYLSSLYPLDTLENISRDDDKISITSQKVQAYNFDNIVGKGYKSCDALSINVKNNSVTFIEFKNRTCICKDTKERRLLRCDIKLKALESLLAFGELLINADIISHICELGKTKLKLMVVFSYKKSSKSPYYCDKIKGALEGKSFFVYDVERYKGILYDSVISLPDTEFDALNLA